MARERTVGCGYNEQDENNVLLLVPEHVRSWFLDEDEPAWSFCIGISELAKQIVRSSIGPIFRCANSAGALQYECRARWRSGEMQIVLSSGWCTSTKEAFERICEQAKSIPPRSGDKLDWESVLAVELGFPGMSTPKFENTTEIGMPTIVCTLSWGNSFKRIEVCSLPYLSRIEAIEDAMKQAKAIGPAPFPEPVSIPAPKPREVAPTPPTNWERAARREVKTNVSPLAIDFVPSKGGTNVSCRIRWGKGLGLAVESFPMASKVEAFDQAVQVFKRRLVAISLKATPKLKIDRQDNEPVVRVTDALDGKAIALLDRAKHHWSVEHEWLMKQSVQTKDRIQRLHELNTFLVLLDPLRCYEIDRGARSVAIGRIGMELQRIHSSQGKESASLRHTLQLRSLLGQRFAEAGTKVVKTEAFKSQAMSGGFKPEEAMAEMVQAQLLRKSPTGELSISTLGSNLLERNLRSDLVPGTLGSALPQEVALVLLNLKDALLVD